MNLDDHCISLASAEKLITPRTKAIIPVHLYGNVCDMDPLLAFAKRHNLLVIEDNAEAFGGTYKGRKTGTLGQMAACSFCQNKTFTTGGEGGMVTTDDEELAWQARSFRDHGYDVRKRMNLLELEQHLPYIHNRVGWNYRMTEMQSAIGLAELARMDDWNMPAAAATRGFCWTHSARCRRSSICPSIPPNARTAGTSARSRWTSSRCGATSRSS